MDMKKLNKALSVCAGPECCKEACPYYNETKGGKTCRAWLLTDAQVAIAAKEAENAALAEEVNRITAERDKLRKECDALLGKLNYLAEERDKLRTDNDDLEAVVKTLQERCQVQQNEVNALLLRAGEGKTDRKSVSADYWRGRADALEAFIGKYFFEAVTGHE